MRARRARSMALLLAFILAGCDKFNLRDQFKLVDLKAEKSAVSPGETCILYPEGGIPPYSLAIDSENSSLYSDGVHSTNPGAITDATYTAGDSIGIVTILLTDSAGHTAQARVSVLPWEPQDVTAYGCGVAGGSKTVVLSWTYTSPGNISGFRIERLQTGDSFEAIGSPAALDRTYTDSAAYSHPNTYRVYATAGDDYQSPYAEGSESLDLMMQKSTMKPGETCILYPEEGTPPYSLAIDTGSSSLYDDGVHLLDPGAITDATYSAGNSIGIVPILLSDSAGHAARAQISVLPWAPQGLEADGSYGNPFQVQLRWTYTIPGNIGGFRIERSLTGGPPFTLIASPAVTENSYVDDSAQKDFLNYYRIYAVAGDYWSDYAEKSAKGKP
jgi:hypothetical protein